MSIANSLTEIIGRTPLLRLNRFSAESGIVNPIVAKIESFNPGRSVKDRIALAMIEDAEKKGVFLNIPEFGHPPDFEFLPIFQQQNLRNPAKQRTVTDVDLGAVRIGL